MSPWNLRGSPSILRSSFQWLFFMQNSYPHLAEHFLQTGPVPPSSLYLVAQSLQTALPPILENPTSETGLSHLIYMEMYLKVKKIFLVILPVTSKALWMPIRAKSLYHSSINDEIRALGTARCKEYLEVMFTILPAFKLKECSIL